MEYKAELEFFGERFNSKDKVKYVFSYDFCRYIATATNLIKSYVIVSRGSCQR